MTALACEFVSTDRQSTVNGKTYYELLFSIMLLLTL